MKTKRTIMALAVMKGRVHVYLPNRAIGTRFIQQAEKEGFTFGDGVMPTDPGRGYSMIMGVNHDMTLNYVGIVGRMAFYSGCRKFCGEKYLRVDFSKYINGEKRLLRFLRKFVIRPKVHFFAKIQEIAQPRGFRAFWFKTLKYTCQAFFCNISWFGFIFAYFLLFLQKNKTSGKISRSPKKRVVVRFARKKRITFVWYTKVIP